MENTTKKINYVIYLLLLIMISCKSDDNNKIKQETINQVTDNKTSKSLEKISEIKLCDKDSSLLFIIETIKIVFEERDLDLQMNLVDLNEIRTPLTSDKVSMYSVFEYAFQSKNDKYTKLNLNVICTNSRENALNYIKEMRDAYDSEEAFKIVFRSFILKDIIYSISCTANIDHLRNEIVKRVKKKYNLSESDFVVL